MCACVVSFLIRGIRAQRLRWSHSDSRPDGTQQEGELDWPELPDADEVELYGVGSQNASVHAGTWCLGGH